jgi:undecaprenyl diphosphate synthase
MELIYHYIDEVVIKAIVREGDICVRFIGDKSALSEELRNKCIEAEELAKDRPFVCNIALNYGGRDEIVHAVNTLIAQGKTEITEDDITANLYTAHCPPPDLIVRTGSEQRLSNFLLWQAAYAEFYFCDTLWPDMDEAAVDAAVEAFYARKRRFGGV